MTSYEIGKLTGNLETPLYRVRTHGETSSSDPPFLPWNWQIPISWKGTSDGVGSADNIESYLRTCHPEERRTFFSARSCRGGGIIITLEGIDSPGSEASRRGMAPGYFHIKIMPELTGLVPDPFDKGNTKK